jgi:hypothetical protein
MITERTRLCPACRSFLPEEGPLVCAKCERVAVLPVAEWPPKLKRWLLGQFVKSFFAPWPDATEQYRWERLLHAVIAGRQWGTRTVPRATLLADCYSVAMAEVEAWERAGTPQLY